MMWMRVSCDWLVPCRKVELFRPCVDTLNPEYFMDAQCILKPRPKIKQKTLADTRSIIALIPNNSSLYQYYRPLVCNEDEKSNQNDDENDEDDESVRAAMETSAYNVLIKMKRRLQHIQMQKTGKRVELSQYKRKKRKSKENADETKCDAKMKWTSDQLCSSIKGITVAMLRTELKTHKLKIPKLKKEMISSLSIHYAKVHVVGAPATSAEQAPAIAAGNGFDFSAFPDIQSNIPPAVSLDILEEFGSNELDTVETPDLLDHCHQNQLDVPSGMFCNQCHGFLVPCSKYAECRLFLCTACSQRDTCDHHANHN